MEDLLKKRLEELYNRAYSRNYAVFSDFLNMDEQSELASLNLPCVAYGGYDNAERVVAGFGEYVDSDSFPIVCLCVAPVAQKFADTLTHRDFLGALMTLGIKRETLGDIVIENNCGYVFCLDNIAEYIVDNLKRIKHTSVSVTACDELPSIINAVPDSTEYIVSSCRLDVLICAVYKLSRSEASNLFSAGKIFVNSRQTENASYMVKENDMISVRGFGRFSFCRILRKTKKDRLVVEIIKY